MRFLFLVFTLLPALASATHNRAGEIIVRTPDCDDPRTACATIISYTDNAQTDVDRDSLLLNWGDGTTQRIGRTRTIQVAPGVQRNEYTFCHQYAAFGRYVLSFQDANRVSGIRNIAAPSVNIPFSVYTSFSLVDPQRTGCNNSPELTQDPIDNTCVGSVWTHNPGAFDVDGDSLAFAFAVPTYAERSEIPGYVSPDEVAGSNGSLSIDPRTGQITWDGPAVPGEYNLTFRVTSFRAGIPLDTLVRDMQIFVDDCVNVAPVVELAHQEITVVAGEEVAFEVTASDPDADQALLTLTAAGRPFELATNPATFLPEAKNLADPLRKTFRWRPTPADISNQPYFVVFRSVDSGPQNLATLRTVPIRVVATPSAAAPGDYQLFRPGVQYLYENPDFQSPAYGFDTEFYGVRVDSLGCAELYGSLEERARDGGSCIAKVPSPFGYRICQTADSTVMHFDSTSRFVLYQTAAVGTRWVGGEDAGAKVFAEVLSVNQTPILGQPDSLKTIGFFTEAGEATGPTVTIGKRTGLVDGTRFYRIAQANAPLTLAGVSEPALGVQLPPPASYGLAGVGDTFQIEASNATWLGEPFIEPGLFKNAFATVVILSVDSSAEEVYTYTVKADLYRGGDGRLLPHALDTVFTFSHPRLPVEMIRQPGARRDTTVHGFDHSDVLKVFRDSCGLFRQRLSVPAAFSTAGDPCGVDQSEVDAQPGPVHVERVPFPLDRISTQAGPQSLTLQYRGSATTQCGTYLVETDILLSEKSPWHAEALPIEVYPNPTTDLLTVRLPTASGSYDLAVYALSGQRLRTVRGVGERYTLSLEELPAGVYVLEVRREGLAVGRVRFLVR